MLQSKEIFERCHARRLRAVGLIGRAGLTTLATPASVTSVVGWLIFAAGTLGWPGSGQAARLELVVSGLSSPLYITHSRDASGRLFIVEQGGVIKVLQPGASTPTVFLDISGRLVNGALDGTERGLLGLAFHPQFAANRRFFVNYTRQPDGATVIAEYLASSGNPNQAQPASERILLTVAQPFTNHNGGMLEFGPDELLYIALGDGGSGNDPGNRAQNPNDLLGKILRIDVNGNNAANGQYGIPPGNPFAGGGGRPEIYALGFRNPFRFSFDRGGNGALYAGDVGQGAREEIDVVTLGGNYGWRVFEGSLCTNLGPGACDASAFLPPITEYETHANDRCAVIGGYVYRGRAGTIPSGIYVFGDFCSGEIFQNTPASVLLDTGFNIASFGEDAAGEIHVVEVGGAVYRLVPDSESHDFNGDGTAAILWRHSAGQIDLWSVNGLSIVGQGPLGTAGLEWTIQAAGDFNGDGTADILWRNTAGQIDLWFVNGLSIVAHGRLGAAGLEWTIQAVGDFNGDGTADILWRNTAGQIDLWFVNGLSIIAHGPLGTAGLEWTIQAAGDFNGDGTADILWRNTAGQIDLWFVNGLSIIAHGPLGTAGLEWTIQAAGDFNGDGTADILWRNTAGQIDLWFVNGLSIIAHGPLGTAGLEWTIQAAGDFNGDGTADILWRNTAGQIDLWFVNGLSIVAHGRLGAAGLEWTIQPRM